MSYKYISGGRTHLHTLDDKPLMGTSTVVKILGKGDGLLIWAVNCAVDHIKKNVYEVDIDVLVNETLEEARDAWKTNRDKSAKKGTERHATLEDYVRECIKENEGRPLVRQIDGVQPFIDWSVKNVKRFIGTELNCYSRDLWVGGICDLVVEMNDGKVLIGDHKSSKEAYLDQFIQTALYGLLIKSSGGLTADGEEVLKVPEVNGYVIFPFRSSPFTPEYVYDVEGYESAAKACVQLYKLSESRK